MTYQITVPDSTYYRAKQLAQKYQTTAELIIAQAVESLFEKDVPDPIDAEHEQILRESAAFDEMKTFLIEHYLGQYVAITGGELIGSNESRRDLMKHVRSQYPDQVVLFRLVEKGKRQPIYRRRLSIE